MHILTINYEFPPVGGGASPVSYRIAQGLVTLGHHVDVVTMGYRSLPRRETIEGMTVYRVPALRSKKEICRPHEMLSYVVSALAFLRRHLRRRHYDICHCHFIIPSGLVALAIKKKFGLGYVLTSHGSDVLGYNNRFQFCYPLIAGKWRQIIENSVGLTTPSLFLQGEIRKLIPTWDHFTVIANGIAPGRIVPLIKKKSILLCSRLFVNKGIQDFLAAIATVDLGDWQVQIVGDGPYKARLLRLRDYYRLQQRVHFVGWLDNDSPEYRRIYGEASIFVCPSWFENMSVSLLEAVAAGCRILATDVGGNREVVGDGALLVSPRQPVALRDNLLQLLTQDHRQPHFVDTSRFHWANVINQYATVLNRAAGVSN